MHRTASIPVTLREETEYGTRFTISTYFGGIEVMHHERGPEYGWFWRINRPELPAYHREWHDHSALTDTVCQTEYDALATAVMYLLRVLAAHDQTAELVAALEEAVEQSGIDLPPIDPPRILDLNERLERICLAIGTPRAAPPPEVTAALATLATLADDLPEHLAAHQVTALDALRQHLGIAPER
jgi:hypothetical protein